MFEGQVRDPRLFVEALRQFHEMDEQERGDLANQLADLIIHKQVDLAEVRQVLIDEGEGVLMETLDTLLAMIEPYLEEGGVDE